ncbi:diguanylate cyclase [Clostridium sp.]|uniref:diguanylate cyclase n=1 Tax=Clostridium sp. TaxID=1506 RepID=UPI003F3F8B93
MLNFKKRKGIKAIILLIFILVIFLLISKNIYKKEDISYTTKLINLVDKDEEDLLNKEELKNYEIEINKELKKNKDDFKIKQSYYAIGAVKYLQSDSIKSIQYLNKALEYGGINITSKANVELDVKIYSALATNYIMEKNINKSEIFFKQGKTIALKNNRKDLLCELYYGKSKALVSSGNNINDSINLMRKAIEYSDLEEHKIRNYLYLSIMYKLTGDYDLALEYTINALEIALELNDNISVNKCVISLGEIYYTQSNYSKTIYIYESYFTEHKLTDKENKLTVYGYLAESHAKEGNYAKYKMYRDKYINLANEENDYKNLVWIYAVCADVELEQSNIVNTKKYLNKSQYLYDKNKDDMYVNMDILLRFVKIKIDYIENKDYTKTLNNYENILEDLSIRGIKSDINTEIIDEVLNISLKNDDLKTFKKFIGNSTHYTKKESNQTYTDSIYTGISNTIKEKKLFKEKIKTLILFILSIISIYELINSKRKNKKINKLNIKLKELNILDPLTNIYNKGYLLDKFKEISKSEEEITFIMIDIDYFKLYNDNYGHIKGDKVLIEVANIIKVVFEEDMVFRYGGEEFSVISSDNIEGAIKKVEKLMESIHNKNIIHEYSKVSDRITLSIGLTSNKVCTENDIIEITKEADINLYKSKERGRDRYTY